MPHRAVVISRLLTTLHSYTLVRMPLGMSLILHVPLRMTARLALHLSSVPALAQSWDCQRHAEQEQREDVK